LLWILAGLLCLAEIWIAGLNYGGYVIWYGSHGWFPGELAFLLHDLLFGLPAVVLLGMALGVIAGRRLLGSIERLDSLDTREVYAMVGCAAVLAFLLITAARILLLKNAVISDDENAYVFMAQLFASGRIYVPSPPETLRPFFDNQFLINDGKLYGIYFPGHPVVLAIGELLGGLHWVTTVTATLTVPFAFGVARRVFGQRTALLSLPMLLVSPYFIFSSATLLSHSTAGLLLMAFVYGSLRAHENPGALRWWLLAGTALGWAALTRPFSAPFFAAPWLVWLALRLWKLRSRRAVIGAGVFSIVILGAILVLLVYQHALSGSPFESGYATYSRIRNWGLVGQAVQAPPPLPSIHELANTLARFNFWLFGWPLSLVFVGFFPRTAAGFRLFLGCAAVLLVYAGISAATISTTGPAHYSELAPALVILSAAGFVHLLELSAGPHAPVWAPRFIASVPAMATLCALLTFLPIYGRSLRASSELVQAPYEIVEQQVPDRAIVFVQSLPATIVPPYSWAYYRRNNRPDLSDRVLFVNFLGEKNKELMRYFPDRVPYAMGMDGPQLVLTRLSP
jgi:hypothetical protein